MSAKGKVRSKTPKRSPGCFRSIHRLPTKFVKDCGFIPVVLINTAAVVEKYIKTKEIFQTQGTPSRAHATLNQLGTGRRFRMNRNFTVHDAVEAIKLVLISLPEPLIPEDVCDSLITASRENSADQYGKILGKFRMKSPLNFGILHFMMILLKKVSLHTQYNLMDVRKLATIFVLDVIKPLKLDDPNDGEFLSERMQRLPYLIMVVEKLILNVDIFKSARSSKSSASAAIVSQDVSKLVAVRGAGSGDSKGRVGEKADLNESKVVLKSPQGVPSTIKARPTLLARSVVPSNIPSLATSPVGSERKRRSPTKPQPNFAQISKSVAVFGRSFRSQNYRGLVGPASLYSSTTPGSLTTLDSSTTRPPFRGSNVKVNHQPSLTARRPKFRSKSSIMTTNLTRTNATLPSGVSNEAHFHTKSPSPKAHFVVSKSKIKMISPKTGSKKEGKDRSNDQESDKKLRQGIRIKVKAESLPPLTRLKNTASGQRIRTSSCTTSLERRGSSPKKKRPPIRGKVNSFRDNDTSLPKTGAKRRSSSAGALGSGTRLGRSSSLVRRRGKQSVGRKRPGEPASARAAHVMCFSRGCDKISFMQDEIISPWIDEGMTSDDASLMNRTIRNPRILPVPTSLPSSPEAEHPPSWPDRRGRRRERRLRRPTSKSSCRSPQRRPPSFETTSSHTSLRDFQFRVIDATLPLVSDGSSVCESTAPSPRSDIIFEGSAIMKNISMTKLVHPTPKRGTSVPQLALSDDKDTQRQEEEKGCNSKLGGENLESFDTIQKKEASDQKDEKVINSQAKVEDKIPSSSFGGHSKDLSETRKSKSVDKSPSRARSSLKQLSDKATVERSLKIEDIQSTHSSVEFASVSSSQITSEISSTSRRVQQKVVIQQQQHLQHFRQVNLQQHIRHLQLRKQQRRQQLQNASLKDKGSRFCSTTSCVWLLGLMSTLTFMSLYLHHFADAWS